MKPIRAVLFDVFGTLLDVHSIAARADAFFPGQGARLSALWRERQLEYTRLRTLSNRYVPFSRVTEDALQMACATLGLPLDAAIRGQLMHAYTQLTPFAEVASALARLQDAGVTIGVLSNGDPGLLEDALHGAGLGDVFDLVLSADAVHAYKTAPAVYELGPRSLEHAADETLFVSSNGWDVAGAKWFGYTSYWVNRNGAPVEQLGVLPDGQGVSLSDAAAFALERR